MIKRHRINRSGIGTHWLRKCSDAPNADSSYQFRRGSRSTP
ncbi:hypothetical protein L838_5416 [Mycobacterium avium MAV_120709_2344]|nr:hypothetical protein L838_5416 [Mycobacterium avium MAV_120709_2344]